MLRWRYISVTATFVEVGGEVLPVELGFLPENLSPQVLQAVELSPCFVQVPWEAPEPPPKPKKR